MPMVEVSNGGIDLSCGDIVTGTINGNDYQFTICYVSDTKICLLGNTSLGSVTWPYAIGYSWTVNFAAGVIKNEAITVPNVKIPTAAQINGYCAGYYRSFGYWTSTEISSSKALWQWEGMIYAWDKTPDPEPIIPFVEIDL